MVNDILDMERMASGNFDMDIKTVSVSVLLERSLEAVRGLAEQRKIKLEAVKTSLTVRADEDRIVQVIINLLANAIKFSPKESSVGVSVEESDDWLEIAVSDTGCGIPEPFLESIFERFKQVRATDAKKEKGAGLGLAICKAIVEQHGGTIGVWSQLNTGSTFWFRLPATKLDAEPGWSRRPG